MKKRKVDKILEEKRTQALRNLWPDEPVNQLSFRFMGDLYDYSSLKLHVENDFTGEWKDFPLDNISPYLRGNLIQEYYLREIPLPKELLGGM
jgi:hypothetical protein